MSRREEEKRGRCVNRPITLAVEKAFTVQAGLERYSTVFLGKLFPNGENLSIVTRVSPLSDTCSFPWKDPVPQTVLVLLRTRIQQVGEWCCTILGRSLTVKLVDTFLEA